MVQGTGVGPWADRSEDGGEGTGSPGVRVDGWIHGTKSRSLKWARGHPATTLELSRTTNNPWVTAPPNTHTFLGLFQGFISCFWAVFAFSCSELLLLRVFAKEKVNPEPSYLWGWG